jgi:hypothetical protein
MEDIFKSATEKLEQRISLLKEVKLQWEAPIEIPTQNLKINAKSENQILWEPLVKHRSKPAIYYFDIYTSMFNEQIKDAFKSIKGETIDGKISNLSNLNEQKPIDTTTLYVGSIKNNLHGRFVQHLGYSNHQTGALHLAYWIDKIPDLRITFNYCIFEKEFIDITELIEYTLANEKSPLIGKIHKI